MPKPNKISIVGVGHIGMACAFAILLKKITCHLALVDQDESKVIGEGKDIGHGSIHINNANILAGKSFSITAGSVLCIVTTTIEKRPHELEIDFINRYVELFKTILPNLVKYSPDTIIIIIGNPIGILTFAAWKISRLPKNRIFGIASSLDTSTFRCRAAVNLEIAAVNIIGWAIDKIPLFSSLNIAGVKLIDLASPNLSEINVSEREDEIPNLLGNWAVALNCTEIVTSIIKNLTKLFSVTVCANGYLGIGGDVFLSLPCLIGRNGVLNIINISLSEDEMQLLKPAVDELDNLNLRISL